jgi:dTDP-4-amino-4,6-dideoxygalactose transaminase
MTTLPLITVMPPLPFKPYVSWSSRRRLPFPLEEPRCRIYSVARHGLYMGIRALGLKPGDEILVPAYNQGSEIEALVRAGMVCRFYEAGQGRFLEQEEKNLEALLSPRTRAFYLIHYLGLPQDAARWRAWCDKHGLLLIEDAAQAWLSFRDGMPVGAHGDLSIFCLYKTFGLPDGAAVISDPPPPQPPGSKPNIGVKRAAVRHAAYLSQRWGWLAGLLRRLRVPEKHSSKQDDKYASGQEFVLGDPQRSVSTITNYLLPRATFSSVRDARAANYAFFLERLERFVPKQFAHPPEGASPFAFPIQSDRKKQLLERLRRNGIVASDFWGSAHPLVPMADFTRAAALRKSVIDLPVHQELGARELEWIVEVVLGGLGSR